MLVYGDRRRPAAPSQVIAEIGELLGGVAETEKGAPHDQFVEALILAGELLQGLADEAFEQQGFDDVTPVQAAAMDLAIAIAAALCGEAIPGRDLGAELGRLAGFTLPEAIVCKTGEGYAFYAIRPQDYFAAAAAAAWESPPLVIGLRSIGASLAAAVAAATGGQAITLRPFGQPFAREVRVSDGLASRLAGHRGDFILVDEGPGLSGSTFAAAERLLAQLGVAADRIVFMPSHRCEPGAAASAAWRERWPMARKLIRTFDDALVHDPVAGWFTDLTGPVSAVEDFSGGGWRDASAAPWPPVSPAQERRKFRLTGAHGRYLVKFAGLGAHGRAKFQRGRQLHAAGFGPEILGFRGGFLLMRWIDGAPMQTPRDRGAFLRRLAAYLGFRARTFAAEAGDGADLDSLSHMTVVNAGRSIGVQGAALVEAQLSSLRPFIGNLAPAPVDGRLAAWEWVEDGRGVLMKTDALDHAAGHDLVGFQDVAWDVAGAACEFHLDRQETAELAQAIGGMRGRPVSPAAVAAFSLCYPALQIGLWTMAEPSAQAGDRSAIAARKAESMAMLRRALEQAPHIRW